jgi:hypothetical protein
MTMHAPSHHLPTPHLGTSSHRLLRDLLAAVVLALAIVLVFGAALALRSGLPQFIVVEPQAPPLVEFRAGERDSWVAGNTTEAQSILMYRDAERTGQ